MASCRTYKALGIAFESESDEVSKNMIDEIFDPKYVEGMLDMSQIFTNNRLKNNLFCVSLKHKLRLSFWREPGDLKCPLCGKPIDKKRDHIF